MHGVFEVGTADKEVVKGFPSWNSKQGLVCVTASRDPGGGSQCLLAQRRWQQCGVQFTHNAAESWGWA